MIASELKSASMKSGILARTNLMGRGLSEEILFVSSRM